MHEVLRWTVSLALLLSLAVRAEDFDFESLRRLAVERQVGSVEDLIAVLPDGLRRHYALVFASRSLQEASPENPRAVLFGTSAQLILSFNGNPAQRGFDAVESMAFDPATDRFVFREITFGATSQGPAVQFSAPNPPRCAACHGDPARPIWDVPPLWPGVYGERYGAGLTGMELDGMRRFLAVQPTHARYRYLQDAAALAERETYVKSSRQRYAGEPVEPPNARLSKLLATLNVRAIVARLAAQPGFAAHLDVLLAAAGASCGPLAEFYPDALRASVNADFEAFAADTAHADRRQALAKSLRRTGSEAAHGGLARSELTALRYVAERSLGLPTDAWTLAFERGSYDLSAPPGTLSIEQALYAWRARTDPGLRAAMPYRTFDPADPYCGHLRVSSRTALAGWYAAHPPPSAAAPAVPVAAPVAQRGVPADAIRAPALLAECVSCHTSGSAPWLPFYDPAALAPRLTDGAYAHGHLLDEILFRLTPQAGAARMPRGVNLEDAEQRALERYFVLLAESAGAPAGALKSP